MPRASSTSSGSWQSLPSEARQQSWHALRRATRTAGDAESRSQVQRATLDMLAGWPPARMQHPTPPACAGPPRTTARARARAPRRAPVRASCAAHAPQRLRASAPPARRPARWAAVRPPPAAAAQAPARTAGSACMRQWDCSVSMLLQLVLFVVKAACERASSTAGPRASAWPNHVGIRPAASSCSCASIMPAPPACARAA